MQPPPYTLSQLSNLYGESERTIRNWIHQGLLPPALGKGRASYYDQDHADRLGFLARLRKHTGTTLPLSMMREILERLDPEMIHRVATGEEPLAVAGLVEIPETVHEPPSSLYKGPQARRDARPPADDAPYTTIQIENDLELRLRGDDPERVAWLARLARRLREYIREGDT